MAKRGKSAPRARKTKTKLPMRRRPAKAKVAPKLATKIATLVRERHTHPSMKELGAGG